MKITELVTFDSTNMRLTSDGYLCAFSRCARTGIQDYKGAEMGKPEIETVRVFRSPNVVFSRRSMQTFAGKPITRDHPNTLVDAENWKKLAVGEVGDEIVRDGEFIRVPITLRDAATIREVQAGIRQLSVGYTCDVDWTPGVTKDGKDYDAIQTGIRANHVAVVAAARGGPDLAIGDDDGKGDETMADIKLTTITVDGVACQVAEATAAVINRQFEKLTGDLTTATQKLTGLTTDIQTRDAEIITLKKGIEDSKLKPEQLDQMVKDRLTVIENGRKMLGDKLTITGKSDGDIRRQVVDSALGDLAKGWSDEMITASFNTLAANQKTGTSSTTMHDVANAFSGTTVVKDERETAYNEYLNYLQNAWKNNGSKAA